MLPPENLSLNDQDCVTCESRQELTQILLPQRDAAFRRRKARPCAMKKNRAARAFASWAQIIVEDDDEIVEAIFAPKRFVVRLSRQSNEPVIITGQRVVAPAKLTADGKNWQRDAWPTAD